MHSHFKNKHSLHGMTLIEVLIALVVIAVALAALIRSVNAGIVNTDYLREKSIAHWIAMNTVAEEQLVKSFELKNEWTQREMAGRSFQVNTIVTATDAKNILRVVVAVHKQREDNLSLEKLVTYIGASQ